LDELIRSTGGAQNALLHLEELTRKLTAFLQTYQQLTQEAENGCGKDGKIPARLKLHVAKQLRHEESDRKSVV